MSRTKAVIQSELDVALKLIDSLQQENLALLHQLADAFTKIQVPAVPVHTPRPRKLPPPVAVDTGPMFAGDSHTPKGETRMHPPESER